MEKREWARSGDPPQVDATGLTTPRHGQGIELLQDKNTGEGKGRSGVTDAASSGDQQTVPPLSKTGGHGRRETGFPAAGVWEQGEDLGRY